MTFMNPSLGEPVVRAAETITRELTVVGARFIMNGAHPRDVSRSLSIRSFLEGSLLPCIYIRVRVSIPSCLKADGVSAGQ